MGSMNTIFLPINTPLTAVTGQKRLHPASLSSPLPVLPCDILAPYKIEDVQEELTKTPPSLEGWAREAFDLMWLTDFEVISKVGLSMVAKSGLPKDSETISSVSSLLFAGDFKGAEARLKEIAAAKNYAAELLVEKEGGGGKEEEGEGGGNVKKKVRRGRLSGGGECYDDSIVLFF